VSSFVSWFDFALNSFRISILSWVILANGVVLMGQNVFLFDVCIFLALWAWIAIHVVSFVVSCPIRAVSAMSEVA